MDSPEAIAHRLEAVRAALGLKQVDFCRRAGVATNTYNQWKAATRTPDLAEAKKLVREFRLTLDYIYLGDASGLPARIAVAVGHTPPPS